MREIDDAVLQQVEFYDVGYRQSVSIGFQGWEFPIMMRVTFPPMSTIAERKSMIMSAFELCKKAVHVDIQNSLPQMEARFGGDDSCMAQIDLLRKSLGA